MAQKSLSVKPATNWPPSVDSSPEPGSAPKTAGGAARLGWGKGIAVKASLSADQLLSSSRAHCLTGPLRAAPAASELEWFSKSQADSVNHSPRCTKSSHQAPLHEDKKKREFRETQIGKRLHGKGLIKINLSSKKSNWIAVDLFI